MHDRRLSSRIYYSLILAGVLCGMLSAGLGARWFVQRSREKPEAAHIWSDVPGDLVVPIASMIGGTFGGVAGVGAAVALDRRRR